MALFGKPLTVADATSALESAEARLAGFEADRATKNAALAGDLDFDANLALRDEIAALDRKVAAATDARELARRNLDGAHKAAAEAENERQYKAAQRLARDGEKLTLEVAAAAEKLAGLLNALEDSRKVIDAANAIRGTRPFIKDGEARVREVPEKNFPTVYETVEVWVDPQTGRRPGQYREVNGQMVPSDHNGNYVKTTEKVVSRNAYFTPAHIPNGRFAENTKIVGLKGERLFGGR
jgi:hypothetical protein